MHVALRLGLVVACIVAAGLVQHALPEPASLHAFAWKADPQDGLSRENAQPTGNVSWNGSPFAVAFLQPLAYNATRDATLAGTRVCSHKPCGPLVWIAGNHTRTLGPFLLTPTSSILTFEDVRPAPPAPSNASAPKPTTPSTFARHATSLPYDRVGFAIAEPFHARSALPAALLATAATLAPLLLLGLAPADLAWRQRALYAIPVALGGWIGYEASGAGWGALIPMLFLGLAGLGAAGALLLVAALRGRVSPWALGVLALSVAFVLGLNTMSAYHPPAGWGD